jgi:hypothetical protein
MWPFSSHTRLPTVDAGAEAATSNSPVGVVDAHDSAALTALHADEAHWSDVRGCGGANEGIYFAKRDPRLCVRKRNRALSWTINFAHPRAVPVLIAFILGVGLVPALINAFVLSRLKRC